MKGDSVYYTMMTGDLGCMECVRWMGDRRMAPCGKFHQMKGEEEDQPCPYKVTKKMVDSYRGLGFANGWGDTNPTQGCDRSHDKTVRNVGSCLTETMCHECKYRYLVDSSG